MTSIKSEFNIAGLFISIEEATINGAFLVTRYPTGYVQRDHIEDTFDLLFYLEHHINSACKMSSIPQDRSTIQ
jgi:hypothetical protein